MNACRYKDVTFIYADVCPVCLEIYSIPVYLDNGISNDEVAIKIDEVQKRKCRRDKLDEITNLTKNQKSVFYKELRTELPLCMLKEVQNWTNNEPYLRSISVLNDPRLCCTHLTSAIQSKEDTFIMWAIRKGKTMMNVQELVTFLGLSRFRFTCTCISIDFDQHGILQPSGSYLLYIATK